MDLIIGAGVTGISYANFTTNKFRIVELENEAGGYCRTIKRNGYVWDYSGHFFHFRHSDIKEFVCKNIADGQLIDTSKHTQIYYNGQYIDFPFQTNIHQLPKDEFIDCLYDLFAADSSLISSTFKEFIYNNLGKSISDKFLVPYNEKLYATDLNNLDSDAMGRFFPKTDKESIILNFRNRNNSSYNDTFTYPKGGAIEYINSMLQNIDNSCITYNTAIEKISLETKEVYLSNDEVVKFDNLISTIPFTHLLDLCNIEYNHSIYTCNKVVVFNLGFDSASIDKTNSWIYFPDCNLPFYRVGFYNNIIQSDKMSLYVEVGYPADVELESEQEMLDKVMMGLRKVGIVTNHILVDYEMVIMNPAYVHINRKHLEDIVKQKKALANKGIYSIGRYGSWTYCSIEDNIIEARDLAYRINK